jgi:hypothetical protein
MMANSSGDLNACLSTGDSAESSDETGEMGSWPALPRLWAAVMEAEAEAEAAFFSAFLARRSVALVSLRKMMSNSSL